MRGLPQLTNAAASKLAAYKQLLQHLLHTKIVFIISYIQATVIAFISSSSLVCAPYAQLSQGVLAHRPCLQ